MWLRKNPILLKQFHSSFQTKLFHRIKKPFIYYLNFPTASFILFSRSRGKGNKIDLTFPLTSLILTNLRLLLLASKHTELILYICIRVFQILEEFHVFVNWTFQTKSSVSWKSGSSLRSFFAACTWLSSLCVCVCGCSRAQQLSKGILKSELSSISHPSSSHSTIVPARLIDWSIDRSP